MSRDLREGDIVSFRRHKRLFEGTVVKVTKTLVLVEADPEYSLDRRLVWRVSRSIKFRRQK